MLLNDADGPNRLMIRVTGYQFPDALNQDKRFSWHMIGGEAHCQEGSWRFPHVSFMCRLPPACPAGQTATIQNTAGARRRSVTGKPVHLDCAPDARGGVSA